MNFVLPILCFSAHYVECGISKHLPVKLHRANSFIHIFIFYATLPAESRITYSFCCRFGFICLKKKFYNLAPHSSQNAAVSSFTSFPQFEQKIELTCFFTGMFFLGKVCVFNSIPMNKIDNEAISTK